MRQRPRLELRQLHYFLAVVEARSISGAAKSLYLSQPPLTAQIHQLESLVGAPLLERHKRGVTPTAAGELLASEARAILAQTELALERVQQVGRGDVGELRIGTLSSLMWSDFQTIFRRYQESFPNVVCTLVELAAEQQIEALSNCRIDIGVWRTPLRTGSDIESVRLGREDVCVALPEDHPLCRRRTLRLADLAEEPMVTINPENSQFGRQLFEACRTAGFVPRVNAYAAAPVTRLALVAAGRGVALMPESLRRMNWPGVAFRSLSGAPTQVDLYLGYRAADTSSAVANFRNLAMQPLGTRRKRGPKRQAAAQV